MLEELKSKWTDILNIMKADFDIADVSFKTWILPLEVYSYDNDIVTIIVPEKQTGLKIIEKRYTTPLKVTISEVMDHEVDIKFISADDVDNIPKQASAPKPSLNTSVDYQDTGINPKYTFDTFVVGENNNIAHAASLAVSESPGGKESTQDEFFHTFNTLREAKKQIIISSDRPPKDFETLEERLRSRFEWGLIVDISPPNYETRMAILRKKEELEGYNVDNSILDYIATNVKSNIRELEGSLNKLVAYSKLTRSEINMEFAENVLKDIISPNAHREITPDLIIQIVAEHFGITTADISSQKRSNEIAYPRQIAMYLCRSMTDVPYETIGNYMGKRDHSTIKYGVDKIAKDMNSNESLKNTVDIITKKINPS